MPPLSLQNLTQNQKYKKNYRFLPCKWKVPKLTTSIFVRGVPKLSAYIKCVRFSHFKSPQEIHCVPVNFSRHKNGTCERGTLERFAIHWLFFTDRYVYIIRKTRTNNISPKYENKYTTKMWGFWFYNQTLGHHYLLNSWSH